MILAKEAKIHCACITLLLSGILAVLHHSTKNSFSIEYLYNYLPVCRTYYHNIYTFSE